MSAQPPFACLLIVDFQRQFITPSLEPLVGKIQAVIPDYHTVVATRIVPEPGGIIERYKRWQPLREEHPDSALSVELSSLRPDQVRVPLKTGFNAFPPETADWVRSRGVTEVHVCGMDIDLCVIRTTFAIMESGLRPILLRDLLDTSAGEPLRSHALIQLKRIAGKAQQR
jgi:nicotinamidase-related amidase